MSKNSFNRQHAETTYDHLLAGGCDRHAARPQVAGEIDPVLERWKQ